MAAANNEFFEALSMLEHERGITAEYLIEKIKAAIVIAVKKWFYQMQHCQSWRR